MGRRRRRSRAVRKSHSDGMAEGSPAAIDPQSVEEAKAKVTATFDRLRRQLDKRFNEIMTTIQTEQDNELNRQTAKKRVLEDKLAVVSCQVQMINEALEITSDADLLCMLPNLKARLDLLEDASPPLPEADSDDERPLKTVVFDREQIADLEREISNLGLVEILAEKPEHSGAGGTHQL